MSSSCELLTSKNNKLYLVELLSLWKTKANTKSYLIIWKEIGVSSQNKLEDKEINEKQNKNLVWRCISTHSVFHSPPRSSC